MHDACLIPWVVKSYDGLQDVCRSLYVICCLCMLYACNYIAACQAGFADMDDTELGMHNEVG